MGDPSWRRDAWVGRAHGGYHQIQYKAFDKVPHQIPANTIVQTSTGLEDLLTSSEHSQKEVLDGQALVPVPETPYPRDTLLWTWRGSSVCSTSASYIKAVILRWSASENLSNV